MEKRISIEGKRGMGLTNIPLVLMEVPIKALKKADYYLVPNIAQQISQEARTHTLQEVEKLIDKVIKEAPSLSGYGIVILQNLKGKIKRLK